MKKAHLPGFTFVEMVISLGIVIVLITMGILSVTAVMPRSEYASQLAILQADIRAQQAKAMLGLYENDTTANHGIKIINNGYYLFSGNNLNDDSNPDFFSFSDDILLLSNQFPNEEIVFLAGSGELLNYSASQSALTFSNIDTGRTSKISLNQYGIIKTEQIE